MSDYFSEDQLTAVAQSCRNFTRSKTRGVHAEGSISCGMCSKWNGRKCVSNNFIDISDGMDFE